MIGGPGGPASHPGPTPSQTVGPFFHFGLAWIEAGGLVRPGAPGAITISGRVVDGSADGVPDAVVEFWQADRSGGFPPESDRDWTGFGRALTDPEGGFIFTTVKPGRVDEVQAPHIDVSVFARGLLQRLVTRIYFPDEPVANAADPLLSSIPDPARRATLIAVGEPTDLRFDIRLQGDDETVFLVF